MKQLCVCLLLVVFFVMPVQLAAQRKVTFWAEDGLLVTADFYLFDNGAPYIILLHQGNSSRGEYREIAPKLLKMGFNCLAVDLCSGKESAFVQNETAPLAQKSNISSTNLDSEKDIRAAMDYVEKTAVRNRCVLFGSSFSASLAMKVANQNKKVTAVIAFSPGEYFSPLSVKDWLNDFNKMTYIALIKREQSFLDELVKDIPAQFITQFMPSGEGVKGAPALWNDNSQAKDYWVSLMMFINKVKEEKYR